MGPVRRVIAAPEARIDLGDDHLQVGRPQGIDLLGQQRRRVQHVSSNLDLLIMGILVLFLAVFFFELWLVVPCGGWDALEGCDSPSAEAALAAWQGYYEIDPYWGAMPPWYANVMNAQDWIYNPFWAMALLFFATDAKGVP